MIFYGRLKNLAFTQYVTDTLFLIGLSIKKKKKKHLHHYMKTQNHRQTTT